MAEDSAEFMKTLEENRRTLQKQIGCLAGLLQIFDRHRCLTGRRFGSQRTNTTTHEDAASTACGTDVTFLDPGSPLQRYHQYSEASTQSSRRTEEQVLSSSKDYSQVTSDFVLRAPELKSPPRTSRLSFDNAFCKSPESALIRTLVVNSLHKETPRASVDNSNREVMAGLIRLKNLARSRSVGGRNAYQYENSKFPRSCSLSAHQSSGIYGEAPNLATHRLTVELEEGPGVGTKKLNSCDESRQAVMNLDKALGEVDLKESFRALHREKSTRRSDDEDERPSVNVVARLMGLEELPSSPAKDQTCMKARGRSLSPKHRLMDGMPSPLRQRMKMQPEGKTPSPPLEPLYGDIIDRLQQLRSRNSTEERDTLHQILETLQLKGLLHSPQRKPRSATPAQYPVRQRSKDHVATSEKACHRMNHEETGNHHVECKPSRSECSEKSDATTATTTRCSNEDGGSAKPVRGRSRSPVKTSKSPLRSASKSPVRLRNEARLTSQVSSTTTPPSTKPLRSTSSAKPPLKQLQVVPGQVTTNAPHVRDKRESSKIAHDPKPEIAQSVKSSPEMRRQKRTTSREMQSGASRPLSLGEKSPETPKLSEERAQSSIETSTNQDPCENLTTTPAKIREMLETLKDRQMPLKESSELMTPRGDFQVEEISPALEKSGQCSEASFEQRSPVSVLDNSIFDEDGSPSPVPTDSNYESNDEVKAATSEGTELSDHTSACDNTREFVEELLKRSGLSNHVTSACSTNISEIDPACLTDLKEDLQRMPFLAEQGAHQQLHPQALLDYVYELLAFEVAEYENHGKRRNLVDAIWKELQEFPSTASGDICDTVQGILIQDVGSRGPKWTDFRAEVGEVGVEVEKMIYRDLMEEVVNDLTCSGSSRYLAKLLEGPRRQLFTS